MRLTFERDKICIKLLRQTCVKVCKWVAPSTRTIFIGLVYAADPLDRREQKLVGNSQLSGLVMPLDSRDKAQWSFSNGTHKEAGICHILCDESPTRAILAFDNFYLSHRS